MGNFCTSIHCIDGRIQEPIIGFLKKNYKVKYVDCITEAGPCKILADQSNETLISSILDRVKVSVNEHKSNLIVISGHYDCAGNPCSKEEQIRQVKKSIHFIKSKYPEVETIGIWIDDQWNVTYC